jgi:Tol biopolymer transport system component
VYVLNNDLWAVPFDLGKLTITEGGLTMMEQRVQSIEGQASFSISETGTLAYVAGGSSSPRIGTLVMVDREGVSKPFTKEFRAYGGPKVSPQGDRVAVEVSDPAGDSPQHIYIIPVDTGIGTQFTINGTVNTSPVWTSDGQTIIFASDQGQSGSLDLYSRAADGSGQAEVILESESDLFPTDMLPGDVLLYHEGVSGQTDIRTLVLGEEDSVSDFVATENYEGMARVSRDGRWVAFSANRSGQVGIWVLPYPPANDDPRSVTDVPGFAPVWSKERDEIFFLPIPPDSMVAAFVQTSPGFRRRGQQDLFPTTQFIGSIFPPPYDVTITRDGERFVLVQPVDQEGSGDPAKPRINVVLNWFEELKDRVPVD